MLWQSCLIITQSYSYWIVVLYLINSFSFFLSVSTDSWRTITISWKMLQSSVNLKETAVSMCSNQPISSGHVVFSLGHSLLRVMMGKRTVLFEMVQAGLWRSTPHCVFVALRWGTMPLTACLVLLSLNSYPPSPPHLRCPGAPLGLLSFPQLVI